MSRVRVEAILAHDGGVGLQQHVHGGAIKPAFVDTEFAARGAEPVDGQQFDHLGPVFRPPVMGQMGGEELVELEFLKEAAPQPIVPELTGPPHAQGTEQDFADIGRLRRGTLGIGEQTPLKALSVLLQHFNGPLPLLDLGGVEFAQVEDAPLANASAGEANALGQGIIDMALAVLGADVALEVHGRILTGPS